MTSFRWPGPGRTTPGIVGSIAAFGSLAVAVMLPACTGTPTPTAPPPGSAHSSTPAASTQPPAVDGWAAYREAASCDPNTQPAVTQAGPVVTASTAVDGCRVLVASHEGLVAITAAGSVILLDRLEELDETLSVAAAGDNVWVSGTAGGSAVLLRFSAGKRSKVALPPGVDAVGAVVATPAGAFVTATAGGTSELLRVDGSQSAKIGELPGEPTAFAADGDAFLATVSSVRGTEIAVGSGQQWRTETVGSTDGIGVRGVAAGKTLLVVAANKLVQGAPSGALFLVSPDQGRSWVRHELSDAEVESVAVAGDDVFVAMTRQGSSATIYHSTDAASWTAVPTQTRSESLPNLSAAGNTIWLVGTTVTRLTAK